uniref:Uncharacterized protein n=1 Tax=Oryza glumipatula TaxID=40148 RepID=A0A0D9YPA5_9ORYZ
MASAVRLPRRTTAMSRSRCRKRSDRTTVEKPLQEEEWSDDGEFIELEGGFGIITGDEEDDGGVSGVELERRPHEVTGSGWQS